MREREKYKEGVAEGEIKGVIETYEELGLSFSEAVSRIAKKI